MNRKSYNWDLGLYLQAAIVSRIGSQMSYMALTLWVVYQFGSGIEAGWLAGIPMLFGLLSAIAIGPFVDRCHPKRMMVIGDLLNSAAAFCVAGTIWLADGRSILLFTMILVMRSVSAVATGIFEPSSQVLLPLVVPEDKLMLANSRLAASRSGSSLLGEAISGTLFKMIGAPFLFVLDGTSYLFSALTIPFIRSRSRSLGGEAITAQWEFSWRTWCRDMREGLSYIWKEQGLRQVLFVALLINLMIAPIGIVLAFYCKQHLKLEASWYGVLLSIFTVSHLIAAYVSAAWIQRFGNRRGLFFAGHVILMALSQIGLYFAGHLSLVIFSLGLLGFAQGPINVMLMTALQTRTPAALQGRVQSVLLAFFGASGPIGIVIAGYAIDQFQSSTHIWFGLSGVLCLSAGIYGAFADRLGEYLMEKRSAPPQGRFDILPG